MQITHGSEYGMLTISFDRTYSQKVYASCMETFMATGEVTGWDISENTVTFNVDFTMTVDQEDDADGEELQAQIDDLAEFMAACFKQKAQKVA